MKIRKEYIILAGIIVVLLLYVVLNKGDRTNYELPELSPIAKGEITKMVFSTGGRSVILERNDDIWRIRPQGYKADPAAVGRMLDAVEGFSLNTLAAESGNYAIYDLEGEKRIKLEVYRGPDVVLAIDIGKNASTNRHTFVRLEGDDGIYQSGSNMRGVFDVDMSRLRDKSALSLDSEQVTGLTLMTSEGPIEIIRGDIPGLSPAGADSSAAPPAAWVTGDGSEADERIVKTIISALSNLKCDSYIEGMSKEGLKEPVYTVMVKGTEAATLSIYEIEGEMYPASSSQNDYPFYLPRWRVEQIMKLPSEIVKKEE
ncbi:MAG TPA: DUF4340 domain-containing protein [Candidatus Krumholzibacterium sp.]|nr:DUF4340 domain-containing protein [Candidatus Krumholzibacterium sp.]